MVRDGVRETKRLTLREMPREKGEGYRVVYGAVTSRGARLRTIVTRPEAPGRHPAVMLLPGSGCFSIDDPLGAPNGFTRVARDLARQGYVTMRVDRPGCGDSEGGPCRDVDFDTELACYKQGLRALKAFDFVDEDKVFLFGHSLGGIVAPLMAAEMPVRGIAVYGTLSVTCFEGILGQRRRVASLDGTNAADVDRRVLREARFWHPLLIEKKTPREIFETSPELREAFGTTSQKGSVQLVAEDKYVGDRHYRFLHQLSAISLGEAWTKVAETRLSAGQKPRLPQAPAGPPQPRVLAIWGTADWVAAREDAARIAEVVNRVKPGNGSFVALEATDHFFFHAATPEESYRIFKGSPAKGFNPAVHDTMRNWMDETAGVKKKSQRTPGPGRT